MFSNRQSPRFDRVAGWNGYEVRRPWLRALLFVLDRAGCLLRRAPGPFPAGKVLRRILVVRPEHFGDLVLTLPALQSLRAAFPAARIAVLVRPEYAEWISSLGVADEVWPVDVPWTRRPKGPGPGLLHMLRHPPAGCQSDLALTFHGDLRTILLARRCAPEVAGYREGGGGFLLSISRWRGHACPVGQSHLDLMTEVQAHYGGALPSSIRVRPLRPVAEALPVGLTLPYLILHPGAGQPGKYWFPDRWVQVADAGQQSGWRIVLTGSASEYALCARIAAQLAANVLAPVWNLAGQTSLAGLSSLVAQAQAVVAPDTGIIHLAVALGTPSVALFGPNDPRQWGYQSVAHHSLVHPQPCSFCRLARCPRRDAPRVCLHAIHATEVIEHLRQVARGERWKEETEGNTVILPDQMPALNASGR